MFFLLLLQAHRLRALEMLCRFVDLGTWAINSVLDIGIFPYVLKLLQIPVCEWGPQLVFIWAKILTFDKVSSEYANKSLSIDFFYRPAKWI